MIDIIHVCSVILRRCHLADAWVVGVAAAARAGGRVATPALCALHGQ